MSFPSTLPHQDDQIIYDLWFTRYQLPALAFAVNLNLFQHIERGASDVPTLAGVLKLDIKGVNALCTLLAAQGFLEKRKNFIKLTESSRYYLIPTSDFFWGPALKRVENTNYYKDLSEAINNQYYLSAASGKTFTTMWETGDIVSEEAEKFTAIMQSTIFYAAMAAVKTNIFDGITCLVDVGAGSGCFASCFVHKYEKADAIVFEIPVVAEITQKYLVKFETDNKIKIIAGNFFSDDLPKGDGILFSNILHDWKEEQVDMLLKKAYDALEHNGKIIIHEMLLNEEKNGPLAAAAFNLLMYINHRSQQFTYKELSDKLIKCGFKSVSLTNHHPHYSLIVALK